MSKYIAQYIQDREWVKFSIVADDMYAALAWLKANVQERGVCVTQYGHTPPEPGAISSVAPRGETFGKWFDRRLEQRRRTHRGGRREGD